MKFGLPISFSLHTAAVFGGLLLWSGAGTQLPELKFIPLEIVTVGEVTNVKSTRKKPPKEQPKIDEVTPPAPTPKPKEIETSPEGTLPADKEETPAPEDTKDPAPAFNLDAFSDMVDKARTENPDDNNQKVLANETVSPELSDRDVDGTGDQTGLTISTNDYIRTKMKPCWSVDKGAEDYLDLRVEVRLRLDKAGEITSLDVLNAAQIIASPNNSWRAARDRVVTGLRECAPYDGLQTRNYDEWKSMKLNFQPGESQ